MSKFRRTPTMKSADEFIEAAATVRTTSSPFQEEAKINSLPWNGKREDKQTELFNLRLTEVELEKLRFIAANTPDSMQTFVRKALLPAIESKLKDLLA